jgi:Uma2 family endonuclease
MLEALPKMTAEQFRQLPEGPPFFQLIEGHLIMSASPNLIHQRVITKTLHLLQTYLIENSIGEVFVGPFDVYLTEDNVFEPDLLYVSNERAHIISDAGVVGAPDLAVEVLSPSTGKYDRNEKRAAYQEAGVKELWLIYPTPKRLEQYCFDRPDDQPSRTFHSDDVLISSLFPGLKIRVADLFSRISKL